jgi:hypothetical protein
MLRTTIGQLAVNHALPEDLKDHGRVLDKKGLEKLLQQLAEKYPDRYREIVQHLARVGHHTAQLTGGFSFGPEHLRVSVAGKRAQQELRQQVQGIYANKGLSDDEKEKQVVDLLEAKGDETTAAVLKESLSEHNPLALQVLSGARGNAMNLRSLRGAGDLMYVDHRNRPLPVPILHNYGQGLTPVEYYAGTFGARKGVADTKFAVQDSGFACLSSTTLVRMADGATKPIVAVEPGDLVLGADYHGKVFPVRVVKRFDNGVRAVWRYRFRDGKSRNGYIELEATEDHQVLALMKRGRAGTPHGDKNSILTPTKLPLCRASQGFRMVPPQGSRSTAGISEPLAWVIGLLLGDGGLSGGSVNFSNADEALLAAASADLTSHGYVLKKVTNHPYEYTVADTQMAPYRHDTVVGNRYTAGIRHRLRARLSELGLLGLKSPEKFIPPCVDDWNDASVARLLAGVFDTDGWVTLPETTTIPAVGLTMTALAVVAKVRELLLFRFGIAGCPVRRIVRKNPDEKDQYTFVINDRRSIKRLGAAVRMTGERGDKFRELLQSMHAAVRNDEYTYSFVGKEPLGDLPTYDLEVDHPDHLFVLANGMIVSNSKQFNQVSHRLVVTGLDYEGDADLDVTPRGLPVKIDDPDNEGALLAADAGPYKRNTVLTPKILADLRASGQERLLVRSPMVGGHPSGGLYARDVGIREKGTLPPTGDFVGIAAAQALSEPLTQGMLCLGVGTMVRMADGTSQPIETVVAGDWVCGASLSGTIFPVRVVAVHANGDRFCARFYAAGHAVAVTATPAHQVVVAGQKVALVEVCGRPLLWIDETGQARTVVPSTYKPVGEIPTFDLEVDHPDHLFVLANGLIVSNSSKHSGGVAGAAKGVLGFPLINQLVQVPKTFKGGAAHAQTDGRVTSVRPAPQGGTYVTVGKQLHYIGHGFEPKVKVGAEVEAGDVLSEGIPNPAEVVRHKGIGEGRRYFTDVFNQAFKDSGMPAHRRNVEILARGLIDHVALDDEWEEHVPGDVVPYQQLEHKWQPRAGHKIVDVRQAKDHYLEKPVLHYSIGTLVRPSVVKNLQAFGVQNVMVHQDPPPFQPLMIRGMENLAHDPDWMTRFLGSYLKKNFLKGVHRGDFSDEHGTSYVPALARSIDFGKAGPVVGYKTDTPLPKPPTPAPSIMKQMQEPEAHKVAAWLPRALPLVSPLDKQAEADVFQTFNKEYPAGSHRVLVDDDEESDYPLREITYPVDYGSLPGFHGEDGADLDLLHGTDPAGEAGSFQVHRPEAFRRETKFYRHLSPPERDQVLRAFAPVLAGPPTVYQTPQAVLTALEKFRARS